MIGFCFPMYNHVRHVELGKKNLHFNENLIMKVLDKETTLSRNQKFIKKPFIYSGYI